jgi:hypothetical protein
MLHFALLFLKISGKLCGTLLDTQAKITDLDGNILRLDGATPVVVP